MGYVDELTLPYNYTGIGAFLIIANRGVMPLDLASISIGDTSDDNPYVTWTLTVDIQSTTNLSYGRAAGLLSQQATALLVESGLVTEPIDDSMLNFEMSFSGPRSIGIDIHAQATLRIGDMSIALPFLIRAAANGMAVMNHAVRFSATQ